MLQAGRAESTDGGEGRGVAQAARDERRERGVGEHHVGPHAIAQRALPAPCTQGDGELFVDAMTQVCRLCVHGQLRHSHVGTLT